MNAVVMKHLSKTYAGGKTAVADVSLTLEQGAIFGFLGPNGAGKTTTVKLLNGILPPTEGECRVLGEDPAAAPEKVHAVSGVMTEHAQMYNHLTCTENLIFYGSLFGLKTEESKKRAEALLEELELSEASDRKLSAYSTGMRQRLSIARALMHRPRILFLDEPTSGLDPESAQNVNRMIRQLARDQGMTVFLCTHQLRYAQELCTHYGLIDRGRLLIDGTLDELRARVSSGVIVRIQARELPPLILRDISASLPPQHFRLGLPSGSSPESALSAGGQELTLNLGSEEEIPPLVKKIVDGGGRVYHVSAQRPSLEDIYFSLTRSGGSTAGSITPPQAAERKI